MLPKENPVRIPKTNLFFPTKGDSVLKNNNISGKIFVDIFYKLSFLISFQSGSFLTLGGN